MQGAGRRAALVIGCFALGALAMTCLVGAGAVLGRHAIATRVARDRLAAEGVVCDERFALEVSWSLDRAVVGPTVCSLASGPIASVEIVDRIEVAMAEGEPSRVDGGTARLALRDDLPEVRGSGLGAVIDALGVASRIGALVVGFAKLAEAGAPPITLSSLELMRGDAPLVTVESLVSDGAQPLGIHAARATVPTLEGPMGTRADVALHDLRASATPEAVTLDAQLAVDATVPVIGRMEEARAVSVVVDGLDGASPRWSLR